MKIEVTEQMREAVRRVREYPNDTWGNDVMRNMHKVTLANLVIAAIEAEEGK